MDPKDAINYIYNNQYDSPRKMICTAKKLAADICAVYDQEMIVMLLEAIHNEDYVLVYRMIVQTYERLKEQIPTSIRAIAGHQAYWELFLLLVSDEADEIEVQMYELVGVVHDRKWQRQALRELKEKEAQKLPASPRARWKISNSSGKESPTLINDGSNRTLRTVIATDASISTGKPANAVCRSACSMISPPRPIHVN